MSCPYCPRCNEILGSHAGRGGKYFHKHVLDGPYPNPAPHYCELVDFAFEHDGSPIAGSAEARLNLANAVHGHKRETQPTPIKEQK